MDKGAKDKLVRPPGENGGGKDAQKSSFKNCKGQGEEEDPGEEGKRKQKEIFKC